MTRVLLHNRRSRRRVVAIATTASTVALFGCSSDETTDTSTAATSIVDTAVTVTDAYTIRPVAGQPAAGVFANVTNGADSPITIVGATSPTSDDVQLHITTMVDGEMTMQQTEEFEVAPGETFAFERGGPHIMLMGVDSATFPADDLEVALLLEDGDEVPFVAKVTELETSNDG